jgi:ABC-type Zn2+ transport system substrate-binding protein/surface adhesin
MPTPDSTQGKEPVAVLREIEGLDYGLRCVNGALNETVVIHKTDGNQITFTEPHKLAFMDHKVATGPVNFMFLNLNTRIARQIAKRLENRETELCKRQAKKTRDELKKRQAQEAEAKKEIGAALRGDSAKKWRGKQEAVPSDAQLYVSTDIQPKRHGENADCDKKCSVSMWNFLNPNRLKGND